MYTAHVFSGTPCGVLFEILTTGMIRMVSTVIIDDGHGVSIVHIVLITLVHVDYVRSSLHGHLQPPGPVAESVEHRSRVQEIEALNPWSNQSNDL